jgi:asparagine synthetase B (glutamine-hydrolysing)
MAFVCGIYTRHPRARLSDEMLAALSPRGFHSSAHVSTWSDRRLCLVHADLGVFGSPGWVEGDAAITAAAGEPLLPSEGDTPRRTDDVRRIGDAAATGDATLLAQANGTFALCAYGRQNGRLVLATDCIGARPLYYWHSPDYLCFATSLETLTRIPFVPRRANLSAYLEQEAFCYPLADHTLFSDIRVLRDAEYLEANGGKIRLARYLHWDSIELVAPGREEALECCYSAFTAAVKDRIGPTRTHTLLSGGLDSRCIAATIQELGHPVTAVNFAPPGYMDHEYARRFAETAALPFVAVPWSREYHQPTHGKNTASLLRHATEPLAPGTVFSGDGGGETIGFMLMTADVLALLRQQRISEAVRAYLSKHSFPGGLLQPETFRRVAGAENRGMERELAALSQHMPAEAALHLFLLRNDLRRHPHEYFEHAAEWGVELLLPFYDKRVLASVLRIAPPYDEFLSHRFYREWLELFPASVRSVPWQTYPWCEPCPVPDPSPPANQYDMYERHIGKRASEWMRTSVWAAMRSDFPSGTIRRSGIMAGAVLHGAGIRNYTYVFKTAVNLCELLAKSDSVDIECEGASQAKQCEPS